MKLTEKVQYIASKKQYDPTVMINSNISIDKPIYINHVEKQVKLYNKFRVEQGRAILQIQLS